MGFIVTRPAGAKDAEFTAYARLLRQRGKDLANLARAPDPENSGRRWVHVWDSRAEAQQFADDLREETDDGWRVEPTDAVPSHGPFGPVLFQLSLRSDGSGLALHPLSRALIRGAFSAVRQSVAYVILNAETERDFFNGKGSLSELMAEVAPALTGLRMGQLTELGYAVIDDDDRTWLYVPPAGVARSQLCDGRAGASPAGVSS